VQSWTNPSIEQLLREPGGPQTSWDPRVQFAMRTHRGSVRTENQDRVVVALGRVGEERWLFGAVGDGIGGMPRGGEAAALGLAVVLSELYGSQQATEPATALAQSFRAANEIVHRALAAKGGFVAAACLMTPRGIATAHAGDARVYSIKADKHIVQNSADDVLPERTELIQYLGIGDGFVPHTRATPEDRSAILLTTDGAHGVLDGEQMDVLCMSSPNLSGFIERLVEVSLWLGGRDNATALALGVNATNSFDPGPNLYVWTPATCNVLIQESLPRWKKQTLARHRHAHSTHQKTEKPPRAGRPPSPPVEFIFTDEQTKPGVPVETGGRNPDAPRDETSSGATDAGASESSEKPEQDASTPLPQASS
jgi:serine/threonine protein phosphatase PrpC